METFNSFTDLFLDVWNNGVFGINATDIIVSLVIFLLFYLLRRLIARFILNRLSSIVSKTSNQIDDAVIEVLDGPLKFLPVVLGFFIASSYLDVSDNNQDFLDLIKIIISFFLLSLFSINRGISRIIISLFLFLVINFFISFLTKG